MRSETWDSFHREVSARWSCAPASETGAPRSTSAPDRQGRKMLPGMTQAHPSSQDSSLGSMVGEAMKQQRYLLQCNNKRYYNIFYGILIALRSRHATSH